MSTDILVTRVESEFDHPSTNHYTLHQLMKYKLGMYPCRRAGSSSCFGTTTFDDAPFWVIRNVFNLRSAMKDVWMNGNTPKSSYFWNENKHVYKKVYPWGVAWFSKMLRDGQVCCLIFFRPNIPSLPGAWIFVLGRLENTSFKSWRPKFFFGKKMTEGFFVAWMIFIDWWRHPLRLDVFVTSCDISARFRSLRWILDWCEPQSFREFCYVFDDLSCRQLDVGMDVSSLSNLGEAWPSFLGRSVFFLNFFGLNNHLRKLGDSTRGPHPTTPLRGASTGNTSPHNCSCRSWGWWGNYILCNKEDLWNSTQWFVPQTMFFLDI